MNELLKLQKETGNIEQQIETTGELMQEYQAGWTSYTGSSLSLREVSTGSHAAKGAAEAGIFGGS